MRTRRAPVPRRARKQRTDAARARSNAVLAGLPAPGNCLLVPRGRGVRTARETRIIAVTALAVTSVRGSRWRRVYNHGGVVGESDR
eukprot:6950452-Prymnesium_polylepis.1